MKNVNYDNSLTLIDEGLELKSILIEFNYTLDQLNNLYNDNLINESDRILLEVSLWNKFKYQLGKLGRYKAGGKIFGKGKVDQEWATKITKILDKKGNEVLKELDSQIKMANSKGKGEFPNNEDPDIFLNIVESIASVYESIVASTKLKPDEKGYMPVDAANAIITDMREYVKKFLDVDVNWVTSIMDSEEEEVEDELITDETNIEEDRAADVRKKLQSKVGSDSEKIDSERMKTLKSWRLPLALMGAGASFGALSWLIEYIFPAEKITTYTPEEIKKITEETIGHVKPGDGMTQTFNSIKSLGVNLTPNSSPEEVVGVLNKLGGGDAHKGVEILTQKGGMFVKPELANDTLHQLVNNPTEHGDTLKEVFASTSERAGTGKVIGDTLATHGGGTITQMVVKSFIKWSAKTVVKKSAVALFAGPVLKTLGLGLLGAGALVKLFREKGKRQSRAKTLNDLLQSLQLVKATEENQPVLPNPEKEITTNNNFCGKNVDDLNQLLSNVKSRASKLKSMKLMDYSSNKMFQKTLLDNFLNSKVTSIKVNGKPISATMEQLYNNGLLEAPRSRDINSKQQLPSGWENQMSSFFSDLFKLFALLNKSCKNNKTYEQIKKLFKQIYIISREGKGNYSDDKKREQLFKKLVGTLHNFFSGISKLQNFVKGKEGKPSDEEIEKRRQAKETGKQRMKKKIDANVKPELAHHDKGDNVINEEIKRIKALMK